MAEEFNPRFDTSVYESVLNQIKKDPKKNIKALEEMILESKKIKNKERLERNQEINKVEWDFNINFGISTTPTETIPEGKKNQDIIGKLITAELGVYIDKVDPRKRQPNDNYLIGFVNNGNNYLISITPDNKYLIQTTKTWHEYTNYDKANENFNNKANENLLTTLEEVRNAIKIIKNIPAASATPVAQVPSSPAHASEAIKEDIQITREVRDELLKLGISTAIIIGQEVKLTFTTTESYAIRILSKGKADQNFVSTDNLGKPITITNNSDTRSIEIEKNQGESGRITLLVNKTDGSIDKIMIDPLKNPPSAPANPKDTTNEINYNFDQITKQYQVFKIEDLASITNQEKLYTTDLFSSLKGQDLFEAKRQHGFVLLNKVEAILKKSPERQNNNLLLQVFIDTNLRGYYLTDKSNFETLRNNLITILDTSIKASTEGLKLNNENKDKASENIKSANKILTAIKNFDTKSIDNQMEIDKKNKIAEIERQKKQEVIEKNWKTIAEILPKSAKGLGNIGDLKIDPKNIETLQNAERQGYTFKYDGSRTKGINIFKNGGNVGHVEVYNKNDWQDELMTKLDIKKTQLLSITTDEISNNLEKQKEGIYIMKHNSKVYMAVFGDKKTQNDTFANITYFLENITADRAFAHDISSAGFAKFFTETKNTTDKEKALLRTLKTEKFIKEDTPGIYSVDIPKAMLTMPKTISGNKNNDSNIIEQLKSALPHELSHGEYFTTLGYKEFMKEKFYDNLTAEKQQLVKNALKAIGYNSSDPDLVANELQAYLLFTDPTNNNNSLIQSTQIQSNDTEKIRINEQKLTPTQFNTLKTELLLLINSEKFEINPALTIVYTMAPTSVKK